MLNTWDWLFIIVGIIFIIWMIVEWLYKKLTKKY